MEDWRTLSLVGGVLVLLTVATIVGQFLKRHPDTGLNAAAVRSFNLRLRAWWMMCALLATARFIGKGWTVAMFGFISFVALREFITITPTRQGDHRALFWAFVLFTPLQYVLVGLNAYQLFNVLIPVYAFLFVPARIALSGDYKRYLERVAKIQTGLIICVYCLSFAPALLYLNIKEYAGSNYRLLFFFILMVQMGDALQYIWGKLIGRRVIVPSISSNRTWEGFLGGVASNTLLGAALYWATPFQPWQAAGMTLIISILGFCGGLTMSAIKRDRGVKDYGTLVEGHGGVLDRIDSICFAAPVFYHLTWSIFPPG
ncbi:MAG TPA: phosphatidate cytidylyltransferase [Pirellulales bacterium]|nr:phosphatidate cytidylyltransferase [Pirellulales bacterium]